jgi:lysozyme
MPDTIQPMENPKRPISKPLVGGAAAIALAVTALIAPWEGKRNDPYLDIVNVRTVCYGETKVAMRRYSDAECKAMLERSVTSTYAAAVFKCSPELALPARRYQAAAAISLAYNIGGPKYCRSSSARAFAVGNWRAGCERIAAWNTAGGKVVKGLVNRRRAEVKLCLTGL